MPNNTKIKTLQKNLRKCTQCPEMFGPAVAGNPVMSPIMLIGQAPGDKEIIIPKPFAWTAGKTLFKWFNQIVINEEEFRNLIYISAVCRCFPGKKPKGGDRVPSKEAIKTCSQWLNSEIELLDRTSTRLNSSHGYISYAVYCLKKKRDKMKLNLIT